MQSERDPLDCTSTTISDVWEEEITPAEDAEIQQIPDTLLKLDMHSLRQRSITNTRLFGDDVVEYTIPLRKQSSSVQLHAALQKSYTEFLNKWECRTFSRSSTTVDDNYFRYSSSASNQKLTSWSLHSPMESGMTEFFRQQLIASIAEEENHVARAIQLVDEPSPLDPSLEAEFSSLLLESDAAEWQSCLVCIPDEIDDYVNYKLITEFSFNESQSTHVTKTIEVNQILGNPNLDEILFNFENSCIVLHQVGDHNRIYFGNTYLCRSRANNKSIRAGSFAELWSVLKFHFRDAGEEELSIEGKKSIHNIIRLFCNNCMILPYTMLLARTSVIDGDLPPNIFKPTRTVIPKKETKGTIQIDVVLDEATCMCSRREFITLTNPEGNTEDFRLLLTAKLSEGEWQLEFSAVSS